MRSDELAERIEAGRAKTRDLQIELYRLLNRFPDDARIVQQLAKMQSVSSEWLQIERDLYEDEDPRTFTV
jgi:hypothetical protein